MKRVSVNDVRKERGLEELSGISKSEFYIKTVESWNRIKNREYKLSESEKELIKEAYECGYEDGKNEYKSQNDSK